MRVYVTSTPAELAPFQAAVRDVIREQGLEAVLRDPAAGLGMDPVRACRRQVASADALVIVAGFRRDAVPLPEVGGDGVHPWSWWEVRAALERRIPVAALLVREDRRPPRTPEVGRDPVIEDLRGEVARLALFFDPTDSMEAFYELVKRQLLTVRRDAESAATGRQDAGRQEARLRDWPPPEFPKRPYPMLLPYSHPTLLAGRGREIEELRRLLAGPIPIVGLYAASGAGKSSLLNAGLAPILREQGVPVVLDRRPGAAGLGERLLAGLIEGEVGREDEGSKSLDPLGFVDGLCAVRRLAGTPPVLVIDQFEDILRQRSGARAVCGALLAASVQRLPGLDEAPCRWVLAYRQEVHGEVFEWLGDVLREAREEGLPTSGLPHDLARPERFRGWALPTLGTPPPNAQDRRAAAAEAFLAAITKPLTVKDEAGRPRYPWRFAEGAAERLAEAFAEARLARPSAPLAPELQVVLAHLLRLADATASPDTEGIIRVDVPAESVELIDRALEAHLRRCLDVAFPSVHERTRALLALRELADLRGRRSTGLPVEVLARAIGPQGREALASLATPETRLVVLEEHNDEWCYVLAHDRLAEVLVDLVDESGTGVSQRLDSRLINLRRFVTLQSELFLVEHRTTGEDTAVMSSPADEKTFRLIRDNAAALIWTEEQQRWWKACIERRQRDRRRRELRRTLAAAAVLLVAFVTWGWADRLFERRALLEQVAAGDPEAALAAAVRLEKVAASEQLLAALRQRQRPFDVLERGLGGVPPADRAAVVVGVGELLLPLLEEKPEDPERIAPVLWALDFFVRDLAPGVLARAEAAPPVDHARAARLREAVLAPLRRRRPPPEDDGWIDVAAGSFLMGSGPKDGRDRPEMMNERPRHRVTVSPFRMRRHEVTRDEFRRLFPGHMDVPVGDTAPADAEGRLPVTRVTWFEAYTYASWLGGRLPTEAEWEYVARGGCDARYCRRDGSPARLDEVAWWLGNTVDPETAESVPRPVMQLEPNPWGFYDLYGNAWEICADWLGPYPAADVVDPTGPTNSPDGYRVSRGGSVQNRSRTVAAASRGPFAFTNSYRGTGFRVVRPAGDAP